jgi:AbrB family looped-hinge helix DNA binding protein
VQTTVSSKGQVVLPVSVRNKLRIKAGDQLEVLLEGDDIKLRPSKRAKRKGRIVKNPITGLPCVTFGPGAPIITNEIVAKLLEDFP